ncbi:MAG: hypothetical protein JRJ31_18375 [Deltaproteobacteria bacterium]|nr:hypothetical protein [Deltaproteobacteria bacterium]
MDHYCVDVLTEALLRRGIQRLKNLRDNIALAAADAHELMRCVEVRSLMTNADVILRASLERKETRKLPLFRRVDCPEQDDENWLAFLALKREGEDFHFRKIFPRREKHRGQSTG